MTLMTVENKGTKNMTKRTKQFDGYFESLPVGTQNIVRELILEAAADRNGPDGWKPEEECIEDIECHSRDGFIAFDSNRGGLTYHNFTDLGEYWGGGYKVAHKAANTEIQRQIDYNFKCLAESTFKKFEELLVSKNITEVACNYHTISELIDAGIKGLEEVRQYIEEGETEVLGGECSIMHEFRFLYHGDEAGIHSASVSAAVNTEGPYHRSSIAWAPKVFCEGSKEVEITWRTQTELKKKLKAALTKVSKAVF